MARLFFDMEQVAGVVEHSRGGQGFKMTMDERAELFGFDKCAEPQPGEEKQAEPQIWLVKDDGIYVMSAGHYAEGTDPFPRQKAERIAALREAGMAGQADALEASRSVCPVAYAEGYDPRQVPPEELWDKTHAVSGDDFCCPVALDWWDDAVKAGAPKFAISFEVNRDYSYSTGLLLPRKPQGGAR